MKRLVSGIKPTGSLTLGNYLGAIKNFVKLQDELAETEFFIFIADLHALTTPIEKQQLKKNIKEIAALYIACGLDPNRVNLFIQSEVLEHANLGYIMESTVYMGELQRMTQYKDKSVKQGDGIRSSLFTYPALMAADILLYDANLVPVGDDQTQHLELTRLLADRFNKMYGNTFIIPEGYYPKEGKRIKDLQDPTKKMSKSEALSPKSYILLLDDLNQVKNKIRSAITDSQAVVRYDEENKPGISNLLNIYSAISGLSIKELELKYQNLSYKEFKEDLADVVANELEPIQNRYKELINSKDLRLAFDKGRDRAKQVASRKLELVFKRLGLV